MVNTATMAALGFVFWLLCARLFTPAEIGIATTLVNSLTFIAFASLLGFDSTFIRMLSASKEREKEVNTGLSLSIISAIVLAAVYVSISPFLVPELGYIWQNESHAIGFIMITAFYAVYLLTDSIFIALRSANYIFLVDAVIMSGLRIGILFVVAGLGAYGVFAATGISAMVSTLISLGLLTYRFGFQFRVRMHHSCIRKLFHYTFTSYLANLLSFVPLLAVPLIIINRLGTESAGYYYLTFMVANLLYAVVYAVTQSVNAEGSHINSVSKNLIIKAIWIIAILLVPGMFLLFFGAPFLLGIFGTDYVSNATGVLRMFALASPAVALYSLTTSFFRVNKEVYSLLGINALFCLTIIGLTALWAERGLVWSTLPWLLGNLIAGSTALMLIKYKLKKRGILGTTGTMITVTAEPGLIPASEPDPFSEKVTLHS